MCSPGKTWCQGLRAICVSSAPISLPWNEMEREMKRQIGYTINHNATGLFLHHLPRNNGEPLFPTCLSLPWATDLENHTSFISCSFGIERSRNMGQGFTFKDKFVPEALKECNSKSQLFLSKCLTGFTELYTEETKLSIHQESMIINKLKYLLKNL